MNELSLFDSLFNDVIGDHSFPGFVYSSKAVTPKVDVKEDEKGYTLEMDLPGRTEKDVNIEIDHNTLSISSKVEDKKEEKEDKKDGKSKWVLRERYVSSFSRRFTLPSDVNAEGVKASFKNGVLTVYMQKKELPTPKKIAIEAC